MRWIHQESGQIFNSPQNVVVDRVQYPSTIFDNPDALKSIGIREYKETQFDRRAYKRVSFSEESDNYTVTRTYVVEPRYTMNQLKKLQWQRLRDGCLSRYKRAALQEMFYNDFEPSLSSNFTTYILTLKTMYITVKGNIQQATDYEALVNYNWDHLYPEMPIPKSP